jgi:hypothetical protein
MATIRGISDFKSALKGGGARPNLFEVKISDLPEAVKSNLQGVKEFRNTFDTDGFSFLCKSAALPASNIAPIDVPFRGRILKVAGDRTFDTWTVTVINDEDMRHRKAFEAWMQHIAQYSDHSGLTQPADYMHKAKVFQLGRGTVNKESGTGSGGNTNVTAQYVFEGIFPTNISQIDLSYDSSDTIEEFTVEFQVQFWYPENENGQ